MSFEGTVMDVDEMEFGRYRRIYKREAVEFVKRQAMA